MKALSLVSLDELLKNEGFRRFGPFGSLMRVKKAEVVSSHPSDMFVLWNSGGLSDALRKSAFNAWDTVEGVFGELSYELSQEAR